MTVQAKQMRGRRINGDVVIKSLIRNPANETQWMNHHRGAHHQQRCFNHRVKKENPIQAMCLGGENVLQGNSGSRMRSIVF